MEPIRVCLLTDDPIRRDRWREALARGHTNITLTDTHDAEPVDVVISDRPVTDDEVAANSGPFSRDEIGVISVGPFDPADVSLPANCSGRELRLACELLARAVWLRRERNALKQREQQLYRLAYSDPLTELPNRRAWEKEVPALFQAARDNRQPFYLGVLDLDNFKQFNDLLGHQAGDEVLRRAGQALRGQLIAAQSYAARIGGDEFGYVITGRPTREAQEYIENARIGMAYRADQPEVAHVAASAGVAHVCNRPDVSWQELFRAADDALRQAKASGGNQTVMASVG